jgi:predicted RNase H-like nuclease (RuvC/YqgF family)
VTSSRVLSPVSRRSKSSSRSLRCSDNALDLPFPQEVTGSSSESSELNAVGCNVFPTEFYVSSAVSDCSDACQPAVDQDAIIIKKAKNLIRKGVDCIEKHYHFVNVGLKRDLSVVQLELTKIQQHLDEEVMLRTKNESELINLKSQMKEKDDEIERLRHKEVEDFKNRKLIEEELAKLKNELQKVRMSPDVAQLKSDLNATKLQLSEALKEYEQLKTQTSKTVFCIPSNGTGRFVTRLPGTMLRALHDEQEGETSEVSIQRINEATLPTLRSEKSALGAFNLPLTSRRGLIGVHNANDSYARSPGHPIKLPMIGK